MDFENPLHLVYAALLLATMFTVADQAVNKERSLYAQLVRSLR
jgi:hypothetical protein